MRSSLIKYVIHLWNEILLSGFEVPRDLLITSARLQMHSSRKLTIRDSDTAASISILLIIDIKSINLSRSGSNSPGAYAAQKWPFP
jgi:hypothetical protein